MLLPILPVRRVLTALAAVAIGLGLYLAFDSRSASAHAGHDHGSVTASSPQLESCESAGLQSAGGTNRCSHGPDPAPPGVNPATVDPPEDFQGASFAVCDGDGRSGKRVQVIYAHASDKPNRYTEYKASFQGWASEGDAVYQASADETGGMRYLRFVHDANCQISVANVTLSPTGDDDFWKMSAELEAQGYTSNNRKFLVFLDRTHPDFCGQADVYQDAQPGQANANNAYSGFALIWNGCWSSNVTISHELGHNLGAVQRTSPNASKWDHCVDEWDVMCYDDGSGAGYELRIECPDPAHNERLDCNNDDYFSTNPEPGSWLDTHWNIADSAFLGRSGTRMFLDKEKSKYNGWVAAELSGFAAGQQITLRWADLTVLATVTANGSGAAVANFRTPLAPLGTYTVLASDPAGNTATDLLRVIPRINLNEYSGYQGAVVRAYFYGYAPGDVVEVRFYDASGTTYQVLGKATIADNGRGTVLVTIPYASTPGPHSIRGAAPGRSTTTTFTVIQSPWHLALSPTGGVFGDTVTATMTGFAPNSAITVRWPGGAILAQATTNGSGGATVQFAIPQAPFGNHVVLATDAGQTTAGAVLKVTPRIDLETDTAYRLSGVEVDLSGFAAGDQAAVRFYALDGTTYEVLATIQIGSNGSGARVITIPAGAEYGAHTIRAVAGGRSVAATLTVEPTPWQFTLSKSSSKYNGKVVATMTGFAPNSTITVRWADGTVLVQTTTDGAGNATGTFRTPLAPLGTYDVSAADAAGNSGLTRLRVIPRIKFNEESGQAGAVIRVYFYGFAPGDQVEIEWYELDGVTHEVLAVVTIADNGRGTKLITIPVDAPPGDHKVRGDVIDAARSASDTFTVLATAADEPTATPTAVPTVIPTETPVPVETPTETPATPTLEPVETETPVPEPPPTETPTPEVTPTPEPTVQGVYVHLDLV